MRESKADSRDGVVYTFAYQMVTGYPKSSYSLRGLHGSHAGNLNVQIQKGQEAGFGLLSSFILRFDRLGSGCFLIGHMPMRRSLHRVGAVNLQQASLGICRNIACHDI